MPQDEDSSLHAQEFISSPSQSALNAWHSLIDGPKSDSGPTSGVIKYKDEQGKTYYVTQMESVPEKYRDKVIENPDLPPIQRFSNWGPKKKDSD
jgi:hypothetical protein